jgi:hypothetical protein
VQKQSQITHLNATVWATVLSPKKTFRTQSKQPLDDVAAYQKRKYRGHRLPEHRNS